MINYGYKGGEKVDKTTARGFSWREGERDPFDIISHNKIAEKMREERKEDKE